VRWWFVSAQPGQGYVPALRFRWLTRFYDRVLVATLKEQAFKARLIEQARLAPGQRVLDLGCGTATLTIMAKQACPGATVWGLDGDPEVLALGRAKVAQAGVDVELLQGMAWAPPLQPGSCDRVISSLVFHHLGREEKLRTLSAIRALLRPGGELHVVDWGRAQNLPMRVAFLAVQLLDGFSTTGDNVRGRLPGFMREAGFAWVEETHREMTMFGTLSVYRAEA
jgi:ubiquinone/menaquinone biosynthesis C-methylase UbiE